MTDDSEDASLPPLKSILELKDETARSLFFYFTILL